MSATFQYKSNESIIRKINDFDLSPDEVYTLYYFYVYFHPTNSTRFKQLYQPNGENTNYRFSDIFINIIDLMDENTYKAINEGSAGTIFNDHDLTLANLDLDYDHIVILDTSKKYDFYNLFRHIRNCLSHSNFDCRYNSTHNKVFVMEDRNMGDFTGKGSRSITARMVLSYNTLFGFIQAADTNDITHHQRLHLQ